LSTTPKISLLYNSTGTGSQIVDYIIKLLITIRKMISPILDCSFVLLFS